MLAHKTQSDLAGRPGAHFVLCLILVAPASFAAEAMPIPDEALESLVAIVALPAATPMDALALLAARPLTAKDSLLVERLRALAIAPDSIFDDVSECLLLAEGARACWNAGGDALEELRVALETRLFTLAKAWLANRDESGLWHEDTAFSTVRLECLHLAREAGMRIPREVFDRASETLVARFEELGGAHEAMAYVLRSGANREARQRIKKEAEAQPEAVALAAGLLDGSIGGWPAGYASLVMIMHARERRPPEREAFRDEFLKALWVDAATRLSHSERVLAHLVASGKGQLSFLRGDTPSPPRGDLRLLVDDTRFGPIILSIEAEGAAARAGLEEGMRIVAVGGERVRDSVDLQSEIRKRIEADKATLTVEIARQRREVEVELDRRPRDRHPGFGDLKNPGDEREGLSWKSFDQEDFARLPMPRTEPRLPREELEKRSANALSSLRPVESLDDALIAAQATGRPIFWYLSRGFKPSDQDALSSPTYAGEDYDYYLRSTLLRYPATRELIARRFVLLAGQPTPVQARKYRLTRFEFYDPGFVALSPDGELLWRFHGFSVYSQTTFDHALRSFLALHPEYQGAVDAPVEVLLAEGRLAEVLARAGNDPATARARIAALMRLRHFERAADELHALVGRRADQNQDDRYALIALSMELHLARGDARASARFAEGLMGERAPPWALVRGLEIGAECAWRGGDRERAISLWRRLLDEHKDHPAAAWAATCMLGKGALQHASEPLALADSSFFTELPTGTITARPAADAKALFTPAILRLLEWQEADGSWRDTPYAWMGPEHRPNTIFAITAIVARALLRCRDRDPDRIPVAQIDEALARAEAYLSKREHLGVTAVEKCYSFAYALRYWVDRNEPERAEECAAALAAIQHDDAGWGHEYYNPFATAIGLEAMALARNTRIPVPAGSVEKARAALEGVRHPAGGFPYSMGRDPTTLFASTGRSPACERAILLAGGGSVERVAAAIAGFMTNFDQLSSTRAYDYHSDKFANGGFFYWHDMLPVAEAIAELDPTTRESLTPQMLNLITATVEVDGAWVDSQNIGRSYGTAMALLCLAALAP